MKLYELNVVWKPRAECVYLKNAWSKRGMEACRATLSGGFFVRLGENA